MTDAELARLETELTKLIARSEELCIRAEGVGQHIDELQTEISNMPASTPLGALIKLRLCIEIQDNLVGEADEPIWLPLLRSAYLDLQQR